MKLTIDIMC